MPKRKVVISLDLETDGPTPSHNSCIQLGFAVIAVDAIPTQPLGPTCLKLRATAQAGPPTAPASAPQSGPLARTYTAPATIPAPPSLPLYCLETKEWCLHPQPGKRADQSTIDWWQETPDKQAIFAYIREHARDAESVVPEVMRWIWSIRYRYDLDAWVCKPSSYDWQFLAGLAHEYCPGNKAIDWVRPRCLTTMLSEAFRLFKMTAEQIGRCPDMGHTHRADEDALEQGWLYLRLLRLTDEAQEKLRRQARAATQAAANAKLRRSVSGDVRATINTAVDDVAVAGSGSNQAPSQSKPALTLSQAVALEVAATRAYYERTRTVQPVEEVPAQSGPDPSVTPSIAVQTTPTVVRSGRTRTRTVLPSEPTPSQPVPIPTPTTPPPMTEQITTNLIPSGRKRKALSIEADESVASRVQRRRRRTDEPIGERVRRRRRESAKF